MCPGDLFYITSSLVADNMERQVEEVLVSIYRMTSSNGNIFRVTGHLCGEFTGPGEFPTQMPVMRSFDGFFDISLNKRLSKQPLGWGFETPSWSLWRHYNEHIVLRIISLHMASSQNEFLSGSKFVNIVSTITSLFYSLR